jgi:hypothetical protein
LITAWPAILKAGTPTTTAGLSNADPI